MYAACFPPSSRSNVVLTLHCMIRSKVPKVPRCSKCLTTTEPIAPGVEFSFDHCIALIRM